MLYVQTTVHNKGHVVVYIMSVVVSYTDGV